MVDQLKELVEKYQSSIYSLALWETDSSDALVQSCKSQINNYRIVIADLEKLIVDLEKSDEEFLRDHRYDNGDCVSSDCSVCGSWNVDESRCDCGNRRMAFNVERDEKGNRYLDKITY